MTIGIAGGTCSGKTSVARILSQELNIQAISLDKYFKDPSTFPIEYNHPDYDRIEAIDWEDAAKDIALIKDDIIVEGFLLLAHEVMREMLDVSFFINSEEDTLIARRLAREPDTPEDYINKLVREKYKIIVLPSMQYADVILEGDKNMNELAFEIQQHLKGI